MINNKKILSFLVLATLGLNTIGSTYASSNEVSTDSATYSIGERTLDLSDYKTFDGIISNGDYKFDGNVIVNGDVIVKDGDLVHENGNLIIKGDVLLEGGSFIKKDGDLTIIGNITIKGDGHFNIDNTNSIINGNFYIDSDYNGDAMKIENSNFTLNGDCTILGSLNGSRISTYVDSKYKKNFYIKINGNFYSSRTLNGDRIYLSQYDSYHYNIDLSGSLIVMSGGRDSLGGNGNAKIEGFVYLDGPIDLYNYNNIAMGNLYMYLKKPSDYILKTFFSDKKNSDKIIANYVKEGIRSSSKIKLVVDTGAYLYVNEKGDGDIETVNYYSYGKVLGKLQKDYSTVEKASGFFLKIDPFLKYDLISTELDEIKSKIKTSTDKIARLKTKLSSAYSSKNYIEAESLRDQIYNEKIAFFNSLNPYIQDTDFDRQKMEGVKVYELNTTVNYLNSFTSLGKYAATQEVSMTKTTKDNDEKKDSDEKYVEKKPSVSENTASTEQKVSMLKTTSNQETSIGNTKQSSSNKELSPRLKETLDKFIAKYKTKEQKIKILNIIISKIETLTKGKEQTGKVLILNQIADYCSDLLDSIEGSAVDSILNVDGY